MQCQLVMNLVEHDGDVMAFHDFAYSCSMRNEKRVIDRNRTKRELLDSNYPVSRSAHPFVSIIVDDIIYKML